MCPCSTLLSKYFRRYGPWKYEFCLKIKKGQPLLWSNETDVDFCHQSPAYMYAVSSVYFNHTLISLCTLDLEVFNFSEKITWFAFYRVLSIEFSTCQSTNLKRRRLDLFCNYSYQCVCNHSTALVVIFALKSFILPHFWHIKHFIVNLDTMPLK
jgi:hypothetical protein